MRQEQSENNGAAEWTGAGLGGKGLVKPVKDFTLHWKHSRK